MNDEIYIDSLVCWASDKDYFVDFHDEGDNTVCAISKTVDINSEQSLRKQLICLLHEGGHILIYENGSIPDFKHLRKFDDYNRDSAYRINRVLEEAEAWKRGRKLAARMSIPINDEEWEAEKNDALQKYINWAALCCDTGS
jgi:hypothetical protein